MKLLKVPYIPQINSNACGAAVLVMVYKYFGLACISQQELMDKYQELEPHGSGNIRLTTDNLIADARERGLNAGWTRANYGSLEDTLALLGVFMDAGVPCIICQKFSEQEPLIGHFRIVVGVEGENVYIHDPHLESGGRNLEWPISKLVEFWQPTGQNVTGGILCFIRR